MEPNQFTTNSEIFVITLSPGGSPIFDYNGHVQWIRQWNHINMLNFWIVLSFSELDGINIFDLHLANWILFPGVLGTVSLFIDGYFSKQFPIYHLDNWWPIKNHAHNDVSSWYSDRSSNSDHQVWNLGAKLEFELGLRKIVFSGIVLPLHKFNPEDSFGFTKCRDVFLLPKIYGFHLEKYEQENILYRIVRK